MSKTKISSRGQTVIPNEIRKRYGLKAGNEVEWQPIDAYSIMLQKVQNRPTMTWLEWLKAVDKLDKSLWDGVDPVKYAKTQRNR